MKHQYDPCSSEQRMKCPSCNGCKLAMACEQYIKYEEALRRKKLGKIKKR